MLRHVECVQRDTKQLIPSQQVVVVRHHNARSRGEVETGVGRVNDRMVSSEGRKADEDDGCSRIRNDGEIKGQQGATYDDWYIIYSAGGARDSLPRHVLEGDSCTVLIGVAAELMC